MSRDPGRPAGIEFVLGPDQQGVSEELTSPAPGPLNRWRRPLAVVALAGAIAAVIVHGVPGGGGHPRSRPTTAVSSTGPVVAVEPQVTAPPGPVARTSFVVAGEPRIALRHDTDVVVYRVPGADLLPLPGPACGAHVTCRTSGALPAGVLAALRARFAGVSVESATTELTASGGHRLRLHSRTVVAQAPAQAIIITIGPIQPQDRSQVDSAAAGAGSSTTATVADGPWTVSVTVHNPRDRDADTTAADALAADARLLASS